jgi:hypothetical protein
MSLREKLLPVPYRQQDKDRYCGPATIQMVLAYFGVSRSQEDLWNDVQANTDDGPGPPDCEPWDTTPMALAATLNQHAPPGLTVAARYAGTAADGMSRLYESLDRGVPAVASILCSNHWVVVRGYSLGGRVEGVYLVDPNRNPDEPRNFRLTSLTRWLHEDFAAIDCGPNINRYPVVVGERCPRPIAPAAGWAAPALHRRRPAGARGAGVPAGSSRLA